MSIILTFLAIRQAVSQCKVEFQAEVKEKTDAFDKTSAALKESGNCLVEERRKCEVLRARAREKEELQQKITNLRRGAESVRMELVQSQLQSPSLKEQVAIGEADKGLDVDGMLGYAEQLFPGGFNDPGMQLSQDQVNFVAVLERAEAIAGRTSAYQQHNMMLEGHAKDLKVRSKELEERYKKIVSLSTGADEDRVDELLDGLVQAVISEQKEMTDGNELGRVRDFLRLVQGNDG
jgi:regulatory protein SWI6